MTGEKAPPVEPDVRAKVMLTIWELTKNAGDKFVSPAEIGRALHLTAGYVRQVIQEIEELPGPHLAETKYHAEGVTKGRMRIGYRLHDLAIIKPATALILAELLKNHRAHYVDREEFIDHMVRTHGMTRAGVENRIAESILAGYVEDATPLDGTIRGREQINVDLVYIQTLAAKYKPASSSAQPGHPTAAVERRPTKRRRRE